MHNRSLDSPPPPPQVSVLRIALCPLHGDFCILLIFILSVLYMYSIYSIFKCTNQTSKWNIVTNGGLCFHSFQKCFAAFIKKLFAFEKMTRTLNASIALPPDWQELDILFFFFSICAILSTTIAEMQLHASVLSSPQPH